MRQPAYHRAEHRATHLTALTRLHMRGWSAALIAEALCVLTPEAIALLEAQGRVVSSSTGGKTSETRGGHGHRGWDKAAVDAAVMLCEGLEHRRLPWTTDQVRYYRRVLALPHRAIIISRDCATLMDRRRLAQIEAKWGHLLPDQDDPAKSPAIVLGPRQCQVLSLIRDRGPICRGEIIEALGLGGQRRPLGGHHYHSSLGQLVRAAVLTGPVGPGQHHSRTPFALLPGALAPEPGLRRETSSETRCG